MQKFTRITFLAGITLFAMFANICHCSTDKPLGITGSNPSLTDIGQNYCLLVYHDQITNAYACVISPQGTVVHPPICLSSSFATAHTNVTTIGKDICLAVSIVPNTRTLRIDIIRIDKDYTLSDESHEFKDSLPVLPSTPVCVGYAPTKSEYPYIFKIAIYEYGSKTELIKTGTLNPNGQILLDNTWKTLNSRRDIHDLSSAGLVNLDAGKESYDWFVQGSTNVDGKVNADLYSLNGTIISPTCNYADGDSPSIIFSNELFPNVYLFLEVHHESDGLWVSELEFDNSTPGWPKWSDLFRGHYLSRGENPTLCSQGNGFSREVHNEGDQLYTVENPWISTSYSKPVH